MIESKSVNRRRMLQIVAATSATCVLPGKALARSTPQSWRGVALGAEASISLYHRDPEHSRNVFKRCVAEIRRLEKVFSLYRRDSAISLLNRQGFLDDPPLDLVRVLGIARSFSDITRGAFDVTVQPLWDLYARHFRVHGADPQGPTRNAVLQALRLVDYRAVTVAAHRIVLERPGMAITLNGIAQGYITDKVADLLRAEGLRSVLVNLGEFRGLGRHSDKRPWQVGIKDPVQPGRLADVVALENTALATSGGYGTRFDSEGNHHHLFDPRVGHSANRYLDMSVVAPSATTADALSTGFASLDEAQIESVIGKLSSVTARATHLDGQVRTWPA